MSHPISLRTAAFVTVAAAKETGTANDLNASELIATDLGSHSRPHSDSPRKCLRIKSSGGRTNWSKALRAAAILLLAVASYWAVDVTPL